MFIKFMKVKVLVKNTNFYQRWKKKQLKIKNILIEENKIMIDFPDFEQNHLSITSTGI